MTPEPNARPVVESGSFSTCASGSVMPFFTPVPDGLCMKFKIGNLFTVGILDTASDATIIGNYIADHLRKIKVPYRPWTYSYGFKLPDKSILWPTGMFEVSIKVGSKVKLCKVIYVADFIYPVILGKTFLHNFSICLDYQNKEIRSPFIPDGSYTFDQYVRIPTHLFNLNTVVAAPIKLAPAKNSLKFKLTGGNSEPLGIRKPNLENKATIIPLKVVHDPGTITITDPVPPSDEPTFIQDPGTVKETPAEPFKKSGLCQMKSGLAGLKVHSIVSPGPQEGDSSFFRNLFPDRVETPGTAQCQDNSSEIPQICQLLQDFDGLFSDDPGCTEVVTHAIPLEHDRPLTQAPYRTSPEKRKEIARQVEEMLEKGIIRESQSQYASPVVLVEKRVAEGEKRKFRFCVDYRKLNAVTIKDSYPLPRIDDSLEFLAGNQYFSVLDASAGYWQIKVCPADIHKTAFRTQNGLYEFVRMPFGLRNVPATFMRCMQTILGKFIYKTCVVYLEDIIIASPMLEKHISDLKEIFQTLQKAGFTLNRKKCHLCVPEILDLGHLVSPQGIKPNPEKVRPILRYPVPTCITELQRFLGMAGYYRRFVPNFATLAKPLTTLLKKNEVYIWTTSCQDAFNEIKFLLATSAPLEYPDFTKPFILFTDSSDSGIGAVLSQGLLAKDNRPIAFASRTLNKAEKNWSVAERETLAIIFGIKYFRSYLEGTRFTVVTDHNSLCWLRHVKDPHGRLARWSLRLQNLNFDIVHRPGKYNQVADALSRTAVDGPTTCPVHTTLPASSSEIDVFPLGKTVFAIGPRSDPFEQTLLNTQDVTLKELQKGDPDIVHLRKLLQGDTTVPPTKYFTNNKDKFTLLNDILYIKTGVNNRLYPDRQYRLLLPRSLVVRVLQNFHDSPFGGHMGISKTFSRIAARFRWPHMRRDVKHYVQSCKLCQLA